ncbi:MAG: hypothetical protein MHPSP_004113, partial [Paramarteilia canceri]
NLDRVSGSINFKLDGKVESIAVAWKDRLTNSQKHLELNNVENPLLKNERIILPDKITNRD